LTDPWLKLSGHEKRVSLLQWHPTADYILASGGILHYFSYFANVFSRDVNCIEDILR